MDNGHPPAWLDALRERLLPELQAHGLHIDARTWLNLGAWLNAAQERGLLGADPSSAQGAVRAIVSKSAREQQVFDQVFDAWRLRWDQGSELLGMPAGASDAPSPAAAPSRVGHRGGTMWRRVLALVGMAAIALVVAIPYVPGPPPPMPSPTTDEPIPPPPVRPSEFPTDVRETLPPEVDNGKQVVFPPTPPWLFGIHPAWYAAVVVLLGVPGIFARRTRRAQLARVSTRENLREQEVFARQLVPVSGERRAALRTAVRGLRRPRPAAGRTLDVIASACATAARAGLFSPVHRPRLARPEYLFLVDRAGPGDQQAHWAAEMARDLAAEGVSLTLYEFDRDPRWVAPLRLHRSLSAGPPQHFVPLARLAARHAGQGLIVFADGYGLIDPAIASLHGWLAGALAPWPCRVLMTPVPLASWGAAEDVLAGAGQPAQAPSFLLLPGHIDALSAAARWFAAADLPEVAALPGAPAVLPPLLRDDPVRWLGSDPPDTGELKALLEQLRAYLGVTPYTWLAASAAYPQMSADLTAYLAHHFADRELPAAGEAARARPDVRLLEARLLAIAQLPWCRHAHMPDWLRRGLFLSLPPGAREQVRILFACLFDAAGADNAAAALSLGVVASATEPSHGAWLARLRRRIRLAGVVEDEPADSPLRDVIYLGVLRGDFDTELTLDAPEAFARAARAENGLRLSRNPLRWLAAGVLTVGFPFVWLGWWLATLRDRRVVRRFESRAPNRTAAGVAARTTADAEAGTGAEPREEAAAGADRDGGMVYLSYRRSEAEAPAQALRERLVAKFGMSSVWDGTLEAGQSWLDEVRNAVERCTVMVVFIGPQAFADGTWRIEEIAAALALHKRVILVLVEGAHMPSATDLPEAIRELASRHAVVLSPQGGDAVLERLADEIGRHLRGEDRSGAGRESVP